MRIEKRETALRDAFFKRFVTSYPPSKYFIMQHQDVRKAASPDSSVHGFGTSTFWEFKHATPNFDSPWIQEITCLRLAVHSYCRYIIFREYDNGVHGIWVMHPSGVFGKKGRLRTFDVAPEFDCDGFDFDALGKFMHQTHLIRGRT